MTLIAAFTIGNTPVLIGDIAISAPETDQYIHIPTVGMSTEVFPEGSGWTITDIRQKIAIIGSNIMIAMAGSYVAGRTVIKELIKRSEQTTFTEAHLLDFFVEAKEWVAKQEVYFLGFIQDDDGMKPFCQSFNGEKCVEVISPRYGRVQLCGTGTYDMRELMQNIANQKSFNSKSVNNFQNTVFEALALCSILYTREMVTQKSLLQFYGGAYEISLWNGKQFQKLEEITYLTWLVENNYVGLAPKFFKVSYIKDILLVYILNFDATSWSDGDNTCYGVPDENISIQIQTVEPIYRDLYDEEQSCEFPVLDSRYYCNTLVFSTEDSYRLGFILKNEGLCFVPVNAPRYMKVNNSLLSRILELSELS